MVLQALNERQQVGQNLFVYASVLVGTMVLVDLQFSSAYPLKAQ
jgi:hypothetical protein